MINFLKELFSAEPESVWVLLCMGELLPYHFDSEKDALNYAKKNNLHHPRAKELIKR
jgi:hypothetical protein